MGKKIDRFVLTIGFAGVLYMLLRRQIANDAICILFAVLICCICTRLLRKVCGALQKCSYLQRAQIRRHSSGAIMNLACGNEEQVRNNIACMIHKVFQDDSTLEVIQYPPSSGLDQQILFECWKKHRGESKLIICATCKCDQQVRILASSLKNPKIALLDADGIKNIIAHCPEEMNLHEEESKVSGTARFQKIALLLFNRRNAPRCLLFSMSMLGIYLLNGRLVYLVASVLLLFCVFVSFHMRKRPLKLF